jgi:hypothetical protein
MSFARLCLALASLAVFSACNCGGEEAFIRVVPKVGLSAEVIDFGEVPIGATKRVRFAVKNNGNADLSISTVDAMSPFSAVLLDVLVPPGGQGIIDVAFSPLNDEPTAGMLVIATNDTETPMSNVRLTGLGIAGNLLVRPTLIELAATTVGTSRTAEIYLQNIGLDAADGRVSTEAFERPEHFSLTALARFDSSAPLTVAARSELQLDLEYRPLMFGEDNGRIVFEICGERCGVEVVVRASANEATVRLDPPLVDFGTVGIGTKTSRSVTVENFGTNAVSILSIATSGGTELTASTMRTLPLVLDPSTSTLIALDYTPASAASFEGELFVQTSDPAVPEAKVQVRGSGEGPLFIVQPEAIAFGATRDMATHRRAFIMINAGSAEVEVQALRVTGAAFALGDTPGLPARIASGESLTAYVTFTPSAIGEFTGTLEIESDDPANALLQVPISGALADRLCELGFSESSINFGLLPLGYSRTLSLTITNIGTDVCNLVSGSFRAPIDPAITLAGAPAYPLTLLPGEQTFLQATYAPTAEVDSKANYVMLTDDPVFPERHVSIIGSADGYIDIYVEPPIVDFGQSLVDCTSPVTQVTVFNAGTRAAYIDSITLNSATAEIISSPPTLPAELRPGNTVKTNLSYRPADFGRDTAELEIVVRDTAFPIIVPILGEGAANPRATDSFVQNASRKVDVLFVIDDSCSMFDEQSQLAMSFRDFIDEAEMRSVDFHIGVTTTTLFPSPGLLVGPVLSPAIPQLDATFAAQVNVGINGSGIEQGLEAMAAALSLAEAGVQPNVELIRSDATLFVVVVSDEEDQSPASTLFYLNELRDASPNGFLFAGITGQENGCGNFMPTGGSGSGAAPGLRYEDFIDQTNGLSESICADWSMTLSALGSAAFGLTARFDLMRPADETQPIEVRVNGNVVSPSEWTYDPSDAAVHFDTPPSEGSMITVEYTPSC